MWFSAFETWKQKKRNEEVGVNSSRSLVRSSHIVLFVMTMIWTSYNDSEMEIVASTVIHEIYD